MNFDSISLDDARKLNNYKWRKFPEDVIPSWIADMDYPAAGPIRNFVEELGKQGNLCYACESEAEVLKTVFSKRMQSKYGWKTDPADMDIMEDIVQGIYVTVMSLSQSDEKVIVQVPAYHPILNACRELGREMLLNPLKPSESGWEIDFERLENSIDEKTRLLILVNPQNPTGHVYTREELSRFAEIALAHDLYVLADEVHCDLIYSDGGAHIPFASLGTEIAQRTITFNSASKSHNLGGIRCCIAHYGSESLRAKFSFPFRMLGGGNAIGYTTTRLAWEECEDWLDYTVRYLQTNRDFLTNWLEANFPTVHHIPNQATYLAWIDFSPLGLGIDIAELLLREARVACYSGAMFGEDYQACIRVNFATSRPILEEKLDRIGRVLTGSS